MCDRKRIGGRQRSHFALHERLLLAGKDNVTVFKIIAAVLTDWFRK